MRLDKFLKITRIIKRRTVAKELADNGNISINGEEKKSSYNVKKGDILDIKYFNFSEKLLEMGSAFANKVWNASRFVLSKDRKTHV